MHLSGPIDQEAKRRNGLSSALVPISQELKDPQVSHQWLTRGYRLSRDPSDRVCLNTICREEPGNEAQNHGVLWLMMNGAAYRCCHLLPAVPHFAFCQDSEFVSNCSTGGSNET